MLVAEQSPSRMRGTAFFPAGVSLLAWYWFASLPLVSLDRSQTKRDQRQEALLRLKETDRDPVPCDSWAQLADALEALDAEDEASEAKDSGDAEVILNGEAKTLESYAQDYVSKLDENKTTLRVSIVDWEAVYGRATFKHMKESCDDDTVEAKSGFMVEGMESVDDIFDAAKTRADFAILSTRRGKDWVAQTAELVATHTGNDIYKGILNDMPILSWHWNFKDNPAAAGDMPFDAEDMSAVLPGADWQPMTLAAAVNVLRNAVKDSESKQVKELLFVAADGNGMDAGVYVAVQLDLHPKVLRMVEVPDPESWAFYIDLAETAMSIAAEHQGPLKVYGHRNGNFSMEAFLPDNL